MESGLRSLSNVSGVSKGERDSLRDSKPAEEFKAQEAVATIEASTGDSAHVLERALERDDSKENLNQQQSESESDSASSSASSSSSKSTETSAEIGA